MSETVFVVCRQMFWLKGHYSKDKWDKKCVEAENRGIDIETFLPLKEGRKLMLHL
jgi:hypothetical protein